MLTHATKTVQAIKGVLDFASGGGLHRRSVGANLAAFGRVFGAFGILPTNGANFSGLESGVVLNRSQCVRGRDRALLSRVAGEYQPTMLRLHQFDEGVQITSADRSRFVQNDDCTSGNLSCGENSCKGLRGQAVRLEIAHLLALRSQHDDRMAGGGQTAFDLL